MRVENVVACVRRMSNWKDSNLHQVMGEGLQECFSDGDVP